MCATLLKAFSLQSIQKYAFIVFNPNYPPSPSKSTTWGQFHRAALADKIAYQKNLLSRFLWLPAKLSYKMYAFWLVVCFILLSKNICLANFLC